MGSKKYPVHNEYSSFLSNNAGFDNAYTDLMHTNYHFEIASPALEGKIYQYNI